MTSKMIILLLSFCALTRSSPLEPLADDFAATWQPERRFAGLRFECSGALNAGSLSSAVAAAADDFSGFGWVQIAPTSRVVGEFRSTREAAVAFESFLRGADAAQAAGASQISCNVSRYGDTLIKLLFPEFRILDASRKTCFEVPPHACADVVHLPDEAPPNADDL